MLCIRGSLSTLIIILVARLLTPAYGPGKGGSERSCVLSKHTQLERGRAGIPTQVCLNLKRMLSPTHHAQVRLLRGIDPGQVRILTRSGCGGADVYRRKSCWDETELASACPRAIPPITNPHPPPHPPTPAFNVLPSPSFFFPDIFPFQSLKL